MSRETERLKKKFLDRQAAIDEERRRIRRTPNQVMAEDASRAEVSTYDFWCDECQEDFAAPAYRTVHRLYGDPVVCYRARHGCGEECVRLVSHRDHDLYYARSEKVRRQRAQYEAETITPDRPGFRTLYGRQGFEDGLEETERSTIERAREIGHRGTSLGLAEELDRIRNL
jgi:hypothetical protein